MNTVSRRLLAVQSPIIPLVADWIRQSPGTISLGQGVVGYGPPPAALQCLPGFLADADNHKYRPVHGIAPLVELLEVQWRDRGVSMAGRRVMVTAGGNMAFNNALLAIADPGDEVILLRPYYFNHEMAVVMADCRPVLVDTDDRHQPSVEAVAAAITPRTRAIVTVSPNNPTGAVYPPAILANINGLCRERGMYHIHDEAYEHFLWDGAVPYTPGATADGAGHTILLHSLSKTYGFASWRIGAMLMPDHLFEAARKIQDTILICPPVISQYAAVGALQTDPAWRNERIAAIGEVRLIVMDELAALRNLCDIPPADGAFYFFARLHRPADPVEVVRRLIREHGVAVIPGTTFGAAGCTLRISYGALSKDSASEGIGRLVKGLRSILR